MSDLSVLFSCHESGKFLATAGIDLSSGAVAPAGELVYVYVDANNCITLAPELGLVGVHTGHKFVVAAKGVAVQHAQPGLLPLGPCEKGDTNPLQ